MRAASAGRLAAIRIEPAARLLALACAAVLFVAYHAQRTQWTSVGGRRGNRTFVLPAPDQWNLLATVAGIAALAALLAGLWTRRWVVAAALAAAASFALAAYAVGSYWLGLPPDAAPPGRVSAPGSAWEFQPTGAPPVFVVAALLGVAAALVLAACARAARAAAARQPVWPRGDGSADSWIDRAARHGQHGWPATGWREPARAPGDRLGGDEAGDAGLVVAIGCAVLLLPALVAPREWARTTWITGRSSTNDSPAGYVWLVSLCGLAALVALVLAARSGRLRPVAALAAAVAFGYGAFVAVDYALHVWSGVMGAEGRIDPSPRSPGEIIDAPELLPVYLLLAVLGLVGSLAAAGSTAPWPRRDPVVDRGPAAWPRGDGSDGAWFDRSGNSGKGNAR